MYIGVQKPYVIIVSESEHTNNPREDKDCFGEMISFHDRYTLGDEHNYDDSQEFLITLIEDTLTAKQVIDYTKLNFQEDMKLTYDNKTRLYNLKAKDLKTNEWLLINEFESPLKEEIEMIKDSILENLHIEDLLKLANQKNVILPIYLYEHSGMSINTTGYSCNWDSGQVGFIYSSHNDVKKNYGKISKETIARAEKVLQSEVKEYDYYLKNEIYSFNLYKNDELHNSVDGFIGGMDSVVNNMKDYLPDECKDVVEVLQYNYGTLSEEEVIEQILLNESMNYDEIQQNENNFSLEI